MPDPSSGEQLLEMCDLKIGWPREASGGAREPDGRRTRGAPSFHVETVIAHHDGVRGTRLPASQQEPDPGGMRLRSCMFSSYDMARVEEGGQATGLERNQGTRMTIAGEDPQFFALALQGLQ